MQTKLEVDVAELQGCPTAELENLTELQNILESVTEAAEKKMEAVQVNLVFYPLFFRILTPPGSKILQSLRATKTRCTYA